MGNKEVREILKFNKHIFPKKTKVKLKNKDGKIITIYGRRGVVYYEEKDVKKIIKILKNE